MLRLIAIVFLVVWAQASVSYGTDFPVSPGGSIQNAVNQAGPGDTVTLANGTYTDQTITISASGTSGSPKMLRAQNNGQARLVRAKIALNANWWVIQGFDWDTDQPGQGIIQITNASDNTIRENQFRNMSANGAKIYVIQGHRNIIELNSVLNSTGGFFYADNSDDSVVRRNRIVNDDGGVMFFVGNGGDSPRSLFQYNHVRDGSNYLFGEMIGDKSSNTIIYGNYFLNNTAGAIVLRTNPGSLAECNEAFGGRGFTIYDSNSVVRNNYVEVPSTPVEQPGIKVESGEAARPTTGNFDYAANDAIVENNTVALFPGVDIVLGNNFGQTLGGKFFDEAPTNVALTRNIFYDPSDGAKSINNIASPGAIWTDNVVFTGNSGDLPGSGVTVADPVMTRHADGYLQSTAFPTRGYQGCDIPRNPLDVGAPWTGTTGWEPGSEPEPPGPDVIPQGGMSVVSCSSEEVVAENSPCTNFIDGNSSTFWHTEYQPVEIQYPHEIVIRLSATASYVVSEIRYLPRQDDGGGGNTRIGSYEVYINSTGVAPWGSAVATGTWPNTTALKTIAIADVQGQYVRFRGISSANGNVYGGGAEFTASGTAAPQSVRGVFPIMFQ